MKTVFSHIFVNYSEYQFYLTLADQDKLLYLFDVYDIEKNKLSGLDLSSFFEGLKDSLTDSEEKLSETQYEPYEYEDFPGDANVDRVDVMIDDTNIMIESNSLKAVRFVTYKFVESGYILQRDLAIEKMFRRDKVTKYLRVFKIINQATDLCFN